MNDEQLSCLRALLDDRKQTEEIDFQSHCECGAFGSLECTCEHNQGHLYRCIMTLYEWLEEK